MPILLNLIEYVDRLFRSVDTFNKEITPPSMENNMAVELKIKIKSLAEEAKIIKKEERKLLAQARRTQGQDLYAKYDSLMGHRKGIVRFECRATHLAYAFIRGKKRPEANALDMRVMNNHTLMNKVAYMAAKYGTWKEFYPLQYDNTKKRYEAKPEVLKLVKEWLCS